MPADGGGSDDSSVVYPTFEHGEDLFVLHHRTDTMEFSTGHPDQFIRSDCVVDPTDVR